MVLKVQLISKVSLLKSEETSSSDSEADARSLKNATAQISVIEHLPVARPFTRPRLVFGKERFCVIYSEQRNIGYREQKTLRWRWIEPLEVSITLPF